MRKIILMHQTVTNHDAIGNDIEKMYQLLSVKNDCYVYAMNQFNSNLAYINIEQLQEVIRLEDTVVIYHHSGFWELGEDILDACRCKVVIRYHNITPSDFFEKYNKFHYDQCKYGREQTERFFQKYPQAYWLSDSEYNQQEIHNVSIDRCEICPPFHKIEEWSKTMPDETVLQKLMLDDRLEVLFVGRIAPNKGHLFMLDILNCYCENYDRSIILRIIGKPDDLLEKYNREIEQRIRGYEIDINVEFVGEINDATLLAYYLGSDVFLCASEHEGFCVPILEAQSCQLPIIARDLCAVPDTLGEGQLLLGEDVREYAAALREIRTNDNLVEYLRNKGKMNYDTMYLDKVIRKKFINFMEDKLGVTV